MTIRNKILLLAILSCSPVGRLSAQDLREDVTVSYQETPEIREYQKISFNPTLRLTPVSQSPLNYSLRAPQVESTRRIATMAPVAYADSLETSSYRGYAALAFMPKFNMAASAGYKVLDTDHTRLNAWMQYDASVYSAGKKFYGYDRYLRRHTATVGADLHQAVGKYSFIDVGLDYTFAHYNTPGGLLDPSVDPDQFSPIYNLRNQNINELNVSALWTYTHRGIHYGLGAAYQRFAFQSRLGMENADPDDMRPVSPLRQNRFDVGAYFFGKIAGANSAGVDLRFTALNSGHNFVAVPLPYQIEKAPQTNPSVLSIHPYYRFDIRQFRLDLGLNIDLRFNSGSFFAIAPQASATWLPNQFIKLYAKVTGGTHLNTAATLYDITTYAIPFTSWRPSKIPVEAEAGFTFGQWRGFFAEIQVGYAITDNWLMPTSFETAPSSTTFTPIDLKGYHLGATVGYNWRGIVEARASLEMAPHSYHRGYYRWRDRASRVLSAEIRVTPIKPLDLKIGYEYRGGRRTYIETAVAQPDPEYINLESVSNLSFGASYRITPRWSAFLTGENLLNHKSLLVGGIPAQGLTGLIGASYKF